MSAVVDKNRKGFAFLVFEKPGVKDIFVPPREANGLFQGDRVEVCLSPDNEVIELKVLSRRFSEVVGRYFTESGHSRGPRGGRLAIERRKMSEEIFVPAGCREARDGDWVRARIIHHERGYHHATAEIVQVFGNILPASSDIGSIAAEYGLIEHHSKEAVREAVDARMGGESDFRAHGRRDLRHMPFITIDGETARDFDDAVFVERSGPGFILWVAIADVSFFVRPGTALDRDARARGTSVYFPERAFHMLPGELSENLCSLKPGVPRHAFTAKISLDSSGRRTGLELMESVIQSRRRATYNEIAAEHDLHGKNPDWEFAPHFELYARLRRRRMERGSIDFDMPEAEAIVDHLGEPVSISKRERLDSHKLIEEFMICANEGVTEWICARGWPFVYRVHAEPDAAKIAEFARMAARTGTRIETKTGLSKALSVFLRKIADHPAASLFNMLLLRSLKQAVYATSNIGHFGLASRAYTHFTSPIRRYPDLVVHRLLKAALKHGGTQGKQSAGDHRDLDSIAAHCSYRERLADEASREAMRLKQSRLVARMLGEEFEAIISGMTENGFFVQIQEPFVEGFVSLESMEDDQYRLDSERMVFSGRRRKRVFAMGQKIHVRAVRADIETRQIDFALAVK